MKLSSGIATAIVLSLVVAGPTACGEKGAAERAGKKIDDTVEKVGEKVGNTVEKVGEKVEEAGGKIKEAAKGTRK